MLKNKKILITGGAGFLGSCIVKELVRRGVPKSNIFVPRSKDCDLREARNCQRVVKNKDIVIHAAGTVGGIGFNLEVPGKAFYDNAIMGIQMIEASHKVGVKKFVTIGTVCAYPKFTPAPFREKNLWDGCPEETGAPYGLAKKILLVQGQAYRQQYGLNIIHLLLTNLYGPGDNFDPKSSHVIAALIRKFVTAKTQGDNEVVVFGTGKPTRDFIYVADAARAIVLATEKYNKAEPINIGSGYEISIKKLVLLIKKITGFQGRVVWDKSKPDGQPRRILNTSRAQKEFGFKAKTNFEVGLKNTIDWFKENVN